MTFLDSTYNWNKKKKYMPYSVWLLLLSIMSSSFIHVVTDDRISFFFMTDYSNVGIYRFFFIHSSTDRQIVPYLWYREWCCSWMWMCKYLWDAGFISFRYIPRSGVAGQYDSSIFNFLEDPHAVFHNGYITRHIFTNDVQRCPFLHILANALSLLFLIMIILTGVS